MLNTHGFTYFKNDVRNDDEQGDNQLFSPAVGCRFRP